MERRNTTQTLKTSPHSIEAEQAVLGGLMLDNSAWDTVADRIVEQDFYRREHQLIFQAMVQLSARQQPFDIVTLSENLEISDQLPEGGGLAYLGELAKNTPSVANIRAYADIVRERSVLRQLISVATTIADSAFNPEGRSSVDLLDEAERNIFQIAEQGVKTSGPIPLRSLLTKAVERIDELFSNNEPITGLTTGFADLDHMTSGLQPSDLIVVAGRPSMGKTAFAINLAENAVMKTNKPVLIFSLEMPSNALVMRMLSSFGRIDQTKIRNGRLDDEDWPRLSSAVSLLSDRNLYIDDAPALSPTEIRARARRVARETGQLGLIVVDYLQLMRVPGTSENRVTEISEITRSLKALAKELNVPVIALSQLNRSLEQRTDKRPVMSDLRESGSIEQDADLIMFIYRDEVYNPDSTRKGIAEIIIGKQRNGPTGKVDLAFFGKYTKFEDLAQSMYEGY